MNKEGLVYRTPASAVVSADRRETVRSGPRSKRSAARRGTPRLLVRAAICLAVCVAVLIAFFVSLVASAPPLKSEQKQIVRRAVVLLKEKGFDDEVFVLENLTVFRADDNWLNASIAKESAYAATNFPFQIMTLYPDFFTYPSDDVERAAILLHEARHLMGEDEKGAYEFVWKNRARLGWTQASYAGSAIWTNIRHQTREHVPGLFICDFKEFLDCTE
jgi:hypothetical protein